MLGRLDLLAALTAVAEKLNRRSVVARIYIVGGAAMALAYDANRVTRDIDALVLEGHGAVFDAVREVARERGLSPSWLNEQASAYMPRQDRRGVVVFDNPNMRVIAADADRLLAMKVRSARRSDLADIELLAHRLGTSTPEEIFAVVEAVYPNEAIPDRGRLVVEELFGPKPDSPCQALR